MKWFLNLLAQLDQPSYKGSYTRESKEEGGWSRIMSQEEINSLIASMAHN